MNNRDKPKKDFTHKQPRTDESILDTEQFKDQFKYSFFWDIKFQNIWSMMVAAGSNMPA